MFEPDIIAQNKPLTLYQAAVSGNLAIVRQHIQDNPGLVNNPDAVGKTALHHAAEAGKQLVVAYLVKEAKASTALKDAGGYTPLHLAAANDQVVTVEWWWGNCPEDFKIESAAGQGVYQIAVSNGSSSVMSFLEKKCSPNKQENAKAASAEEKELPLHELVRRDFNGSKKKAIHRVLGKDPTLVNQPDQDGNTPFIYAIKAQNLGLVQLFLAEGSQVKLKQRNLNGRIPLHEAALFATTQIIDEVYKKNIGIANTEDENGYTPLQLAAKENNKEVVQWWGKNHKADFTHVNKKDQSVVDVACLSNSQKVVGYLVEIGFITTDRMNELIRNNLVPKAMKDFLKGLRTARSKQAASSHSTPKSGIKQNQSDKAGQDLLSRLKQGTTLADVQTTVERDKANIELTDEDGCTALMLAVKNKDERIVRLLIKNIGNKKIKGIIDRQNKDGNSALMLAASECLPKILEELLQAQADCNLVDSGGNNALMLAITADRYRYEEDQKVVINKLIGPISFKLHFKINYQRKDGCTALMLAVQLATNCADDYYLDIIQSLLKVGALVNDAVISLAVGSNKEKILRVLKSKEPQEIKQDESDKVVVDPVAVPATQLLPPPVKPEMEKMPVPAAKSRTGKTSAPAVTQKKEPKQTKQKAVNPGSEEQSFFDRNYAKARDAVQTGRYQEAISFLEKCNSALNKLKEILKAETFDKLQQKCGELKKCIEEGQQKVIQQAAALAGQHKSIESDQNKDGSAQQQAVGVNSPQAPLPQLSKRSYKLKPTITADILADCEEIPVIFLNELSTDSFDEEKPDNPRIAGVIQKITEEFNSQDNKEKYGNVLGLMLSGTQILKNFNRLRQFDLLKVFFPEIDDFCKKPEQAAKLFVELTALEKSDLPNKAHAFACVVISTLANDIAESNKWPIESGVKSALLSIDAQNFNHMQGVRNKALVADELPTTIAELVTKEQAFHQIDVSQSQNHHVSVLVM